ncbi:MAG: Gfo/Idh/MocA family oxidoreductase, partial [Pseudomonadota bacterium]
IVDPSPDARRFAEDAGYTCFPDLGACLATRPAGVILATPNVAHEAGALVCIKAGIPVLVEKPIAHDGAAAKRIEDAASRAGVPVLVGHHRRHNPLIAQAKAQIEEGALGQIVVVNAQCWFAKPADYFDVAWRREPGAGPLLVNLIHDVDLLQHLCGPIASVRAYRASTVRGYANEDTAVGVLRFEGGALGTVSVSDAAVSPWSWEMTAGEDPAFPQTGESAYQIAGTKGALDLPKGAVWRYTGTPSWKAPIDRTVAPTPQGESLVRQIAHFAAVIAGDAEPLVTAEDGRRALAVIEALIRASDTGEEVTV